MKKDHSHHHLFTVPVFSLLSIHTPLRQCEVSSLRTMRSLISASERVEVSGFGKDLSEGRELQ